MTIHRRRSGPRAHAARTLWASFAVVTLVGTSVAGAMRAQVVAPTLGLRLVGPTNVAVGHVVSFQLVADGAPNIGAYQANLRYDHNALEVIRIHAPNTLPGSGALTPLSAVETPNRTVVAGWTCGGTACATAASVANTAGITLTTIDVEVLRPGRVEMRIDGGLLVDRSGVTIGTASVRSFVLGGRGGHTYLAPKGAPSLGADTSAAARHSSASADVNGDGRVTPLDVGALTAAWVRGAERDVRCPTPDPGSDINRDGCMNIVDLQTVAGAVAAVPLTPAPAAVRAAAITTFTVNSVGDGADAAANGVCQTATAGECTLRAAIIEANRAANPVSIAFDIAGTGIHQIAPTTRLPALNNPNGITIDGFTQPGSAPNTDPLADNAVYGIELKGNGGTGIDGLFVINANNVIRGLNMHGFNRAIWIYGTSATNNLVEGNMLGLMPTGGYDPGYTLVNSSSCVIVQQGAANNQIGAPGDANRNVISGCNHQNIATYDWPTKYTTIQNNIAGLDPTGTQRRGAKSHGIDINTGTQHTVIGGLALGERNVSSGNFQEGVEISHNQLTQYNSIVGNFIGTDLTGNAAPSYAVNGQWSVHLEGFPNCNNAACPLDAGLSTVTDNVIVNAARGGLLVDKGVHDSVIARNKIGVTGNGTPGPNLLFGVNIQAGAVRITLGPGNEIANNANGVQMQSDGVEPPNSAASPTNQNTITQNSIHDNGSNGVSALGIDLAPFGTVNNAGNADPNVNDGLIGPVLSNATETSIDATTCASCTVELFLADHGAGAFGSGATFVASQVANSSGLATFALAANLKGEVVTATTTNAAGSTSEFSRNVLIPGAPPVNTPPVASYTPTCNGLVCSFDATASSDSDGNIVSYAWSFGDTLTGTGSVVNHSFAAPGDYQVGLIVTDNDGASTPLTTTVSVVDLPPVAAFTGSCTNLACSFDASSSSDPDNAIASYTWDFGDATAGTGVTPSHSYAVTGDYTVVLTVDDGVGGTSSVQHVFHAASAPSGVVLSDGFGRTVVSGWGSADQGGAYAAAPGAAGASVNGTRGVYKLAAAGTGGGVFAPGVSVLNSDAVVDVATSVAPLGGTRGQTSLVTARRVALNTEYRVRLRFVPGDGLRLSFAKVLGSATEVAIGTEVAVAGVGYVAGKSYRVRFDVTGTNPTTLRAKVWVAGGAEPAAWTLTNTDGAAALQAAGSPGIRVLLGTGSTNTPNWLFDNVTVTDLG